MGITIAGFGAQLNYTLRETRLAGVGLAEPSRQFLATELSNWQTRKPGSYAIKTRVRSMRRSRLLEFRATVFKAAANLPAPSRSWREL